MSVTHETRKTETRGQTRAMLKCEVREGMFPHERDVLINGPDRSFEAFVDQTHVIEVGGGQGVIPAVIVATDDQQGLLLVEFPGEIVMGG